MTYTEVLESLDEQITEAREQTGRVTGAGARYFALKGLRKYIASLPDIKATRKPGNQESCLGGCLLRSDL